MVCTAKTAKVKSRPGFVLLVIPGLFLSAISLVRAEEHPQMDQAQLELMKASFNTTSDTDRVDLLNSVLGLLQGSPERPVDQGHRSAATKDTETALTDLKKHAAPDKIKQDISQAMEEVHADISLLDAPSTPAPPTSPVAPAVPTPAGNATAPTPTPPAAPVAPAVSDHAVSTGKLTEDQARAVVLIKGDNAEGTGFLVKTADGPTVVTNIHVISNNPNLTITTNTGDQITILSYKGATDRDLAMIAIKDGNFKYLDLATDISGTVQPGDEVITPGNSEGGEVMLNTKGKVLGIGPNRVEFDNPIYHGNSGGPVFHTKSGKVIGIVTEAMKVDVTDDLDKASFANRNSAIAGSMRYFGFRLDNVPGWEPYDWNRFQNETAFLDQFDKRNRCLDSYINAPDDNKPEDILWQEDEKITKANSGYFDQASGADTSQQMDAKRVMWAEISDIAGIDMDAIQDPNNFYSFDQKRAKNEIAYRKALKKELDQINNNVSQEGSLPRTNSSQ